MSNKFDPFQNPLNIEMIRAIDQLNLSTIKKHHLRILAHCLAILKFISQKNSSFDTEEDLLKEWCNNQSRKFNDQDFSDLLFEQLSLTAKKLNIFSQMIGKEIEDLQIEDLILLVEEN
tara:strand:+ start:482 stop:835 length:354 start_codon:yes stop_codon:yes gene_type:complete